MTWSTTVKTVEKSNFFLQLPIIWKRFYPQLVFFTLMMAAMIITTSSLMPSGYRVHNIEVTFPMGLVTACHLLWPFALNPWFISFSVCLFQISCRVNADFSFRHHPVALRDVRSVGFWDIRGIRLDPVHLIVVFHVIHHHHRHSYSVHCVQHYRTRCKARSPRAGMLDEWC